MRLARYPPIAIFILYMTTILFILFMMMCTVYRHYSNNPEFVNFVIERTDTAATVNLSTDELATSHHNNVCDVELQYT
jgi:hypothetical protein